MKLSVVIIAALVLSGCTRHGPETIYGRWIFDYPSDLQDYDYMIYEFTKTGEVHVSFVKDEIVMGQWDPHYYVFLDGNKIKIIIDNYYDILQVNFVSADIMQTISIESNMVKCPPEEFILYRQLTQQVDPEGPPLRGDPDL